MRYTKPHVQTTLNANHVIQSQNNDSHKGTPTALDSAPMQAFSTSGAYESDE